MTSLLAHSVWLTLVLRNTGVDSLNDIRANWGSEDLFNSKLNQFKSSNHNNFELIINENSTYREPYLWQRVRRTAGSAIGGQDGNSRAGSHLEGLMALSLVFERCYRSSSSRTKVISTNSGLCVRP
jgi:hypothetical protein